MKKEEKIKKEDKFATTEIDNETIYSDIPNTKNVIKIYGENEAVLYTNQNFRTWLRPYEITPFIKESSWNCDYNDSEVDVFNLDIEEIVGKTMAREPRYISTTIVAIDTEDAISKVLRYGFDPELPVIKNFIENKKIKILLHRYIVGMYNVGEAKKIKMQFGISDEEFSKNGLSSLQVHHMDSKRMENYSDKMTILRRDVHTKMKRKDSCAYNFYCDEYPIGTINELKFLDIRDLFNGSILAKAIDCDKSGLNIDFLKNYMVQETLNKRDMALLSKNIDEAIEKLIECNQQLTSILIAKATEMQQEGKIQLILF